MKLQVENHDIKIVVEKPYEDVSISEWYDMFAACLIGITFTPQQIKNYITDKAEEINE